MAATQPDHHNQQPTLDATYIHTGEIVNERLAYLRDIAVSMAVKRVASMDKESLDKAFFGIIGTSYPNYQRPLQNESQETNTL